MKKFIALALTAIALSFTAMSGASAETLDLAKAKALGLVGERSNGMIAAVTKTPDDDVKTLIKETNDGRAVIYKEMAAKQGIEIFQVQQMAANKLVQLEKSGNFIQDSGGWIRKP